MVAALVQLMGEDKAFDPLRAQHRFIGQYTRSGTGPIKAVARGDATVSISFVHDGPGEKLQGIPVETVTPAEGSGAEIGSMGILKGARNGAQAKAFHEWALTPQARQFGGAARQFQLPSNKATPVDPRVPDFETIRFIAYDDAEYGASTQHKRLIGKWEQDVSSQPRRASARRAPCAGPAVPAARWPPAGRSARSPSSRCPGTCRRTCRCCRRCAVSGAAPTPPAACGRRCTTAGRGWGWRPLASCGWVSFAATCSSPGW